MEPTSVAFSGPAFTPEVGRYRPQQPVTETRAVQLWLSRFREAA